MYKVKDYKFETEQEAKEAQSELRAVDYLRTKVNMEQPEAALEIFRQLLDQDIFHTIVGYDFLKSLQSFLRSSPSIDNADIPRIPDALAQSVLPKIAEPSATGTEPAVAGAAPKAALAKDDKPADEEKPAKSVKDAKADMEAKSGKETESSAKDGASKQASGKDVASKQAPGKGKRSREKKPKEKKERKPLFSKDQGKETGDDGGRYRALAFTFGVTSVILLAAVIAMFAITMTSDNPTILDYETKLQNKYSGWEEELSQKEQELKNREADIEFREQALRSQTFAPTEIYDEEDPDRR